MIHLVHGKGVEYDGEACGFYKFNGLIWDYIDMDMGMFLHGLNDVSVDEAKAKAKKILDSVLEQSKWDVVPEIMMHSSFLAPQKPRPIDEVRITLEHTRMILERVMKVVS